MPEHFLDPEEQRVFRSFARSARALFVQFDRDLQRDVGLPRAYFEILWLLHQAPGRALRMSDLAEATASQPSRITHAVGRLEKAGHIRRELCSEDRRGWFAVLTDDGEAMVNLAAPHHAASIRQHFIDTLDADERALLTKIGERLLDNLAAAEPATTQVERAEADAPSVEDARHRLRTAAEQTPKEKGPTTSTSSGKRGANR